MRKRNKKIKHGTPSSYRNHGCRCEKCRKANTKYQREWMGKRNYGVCQFLGCEKIAKRHYKGVAVCRSHYETMRKAIKVRSIDIIKEYATKC